MKYDAIAIVGPTASGKTSIAVKIAKEFNGIIISADSRQVYRYLDIGTNKEGVYDNIKKIRIIDRIPQYLTDIIDPDEIFSAGDFIRHASEIIKNAKKERKLPIVVGGTGLYIKSLIDGLAPLPKKNPELRLKLQERKEYLYNELKKIDPVSADNIHPNNIQRIIRALEVYYLTGYPISYWQAKFTKPNFNIIQFGILLSKSELHHRIEERTKHMLKSGIIEETKNVLNMGYNENSPGFQSIGYKSVIKYLNGRINYEQLANEINIETKKYLKRQITWFKKDKRINWYKPDEEKRIFDYINKLLYLFLLTPLSVAGIISVGCLKSVL